MSTSRGEYIFCIGEGVSEISKLFTLFFEWNDIFCSIQLDIICKKKIQLGILKYY